MQQLRIKFFIQATFILVFFANVKASKNVCYDQEKNFHNWRMGTKTAYDAIRGKETIRTLKGK